MITVVFVLERWATPTLCLIHDGTVLFLAGILDLVFLSLLDDASRF